MNTLVRSKQSTIWIAALVILGIVVWQAFQLALNFAFDQTAQRGENTLRITVAGINGTLGRYRSLPPLIADNDDIKNFLSSSVPALKVNRINRELKHINTIIQASDTYVLNNSGLALAASNFEKETSFVGKNFSFRPYFQDAIAGRNGRYFALGTSSLKRGYFFSSPVRKNGRKNGRKGGDIVGVVTVKINVDEMEAAWQARDHEIIVTDESGIIFMSSKPDWLFKSIKPLTDATLVSLKITRKYDLARLGELPVEHRSTDGKMYQILTITNDGKAAEYLVRNHSMNAQAGNVQILSSTAPAYAQAYIVAAAVLFVLLTIILASAFLFQRRQRMHERMQTQQMVKRQLEQQVKIRTSDLKQANVNLRDEIGERRAAENELRKTQADLVQAGKLAALGQMSAALSHEFNQPLAAAKSYADNAAIYFDRGRMDDARENISRISSLVDRMATISKHLRNFARKPNEKMAVVLVSSIIADAIELLHRRIEDNGIEIIFEQPNAELWVYGGQIRLQQVLVNLINNGIDALEGSGQSKMIISAKKVKKQVIIIVRDFGTGFEKNNSGQIFDPFFTTKGVGKGLGLGLSISYNIIKDFGGELSAANHNEGGAVFSIKLQSASKPDREAAQ